MNYTLRVAFPGRPDACSYPLSGLNDLQLHQECIAVYGEAKDRLTDDDDDGDDDDDNDDDDDGDGGRRAVYMSVCEVMGPLRLPPSAFEESGKVQWLRRTLPKMWEEGHKVLIFSQFTAVLDILETAIDALGSRHVRLDGSSSERQKLVDSFTNDESIRTFLLSTKAGGQGINLTAADTVIFHDVDFNAQVRVILILNASELYSSVKL